MSERKDLGFTHVALHVENVQASMEFYQRYAGLVSIHQRGTGPQRVGWVSDPRRAFGIVLLQRRGGVWLGWLRRLLARLRPNLAHIGVELEAREAVDALCEQARREGILQKAPRDAGHPVGYYGMIYDPDGNVLELSFGQSMSAALSQSHQQYLGENQYA